MSSRFVICAGVDLGRLDAAMQRLSPAALGRTRWLIASADMTRLETFHDLWSGQTDVIACLLPPWNAQVEAALDAIVGHESRAGEAVVLLHPENCAPTGPLSRHVTEGRGVALAAGVADHDLAALLAVRLAPDDLDIEPN